MFCIVTVVGVHVLYCDSGTQESSCTSTGVMHHCARAPSLPLGYRGTWNYSIS
jgi:hypothetical protein